MVPTSAAPSSATRVQPAATVFCPDTPSAFRMPMATKLPTMNTLKWLKLISSRMP